MRWGRAQLAGLLAGSIMALPAGADVLDQENAPQTLGWTGCSTPAGNLFQSFEPRFKPLSALEIDARDVPAAGETATFRLHTGAPEGEVVAEVTIRIEHTGWAHIAFDPPIDVTTRHDYVIEWVHPVSRWASSFGDPYPHGEAYNCGAMLLFDMDFSFRTYAPDQHVEDVSWTYVLRRLSGAPRR
jgi:hypothetical protein